MALLKVRAGLAPRGLALEFVAARSMELPAPLAWPPGLAECDREELFGGNHYTTAVSPSVAPASHRMLVETDVGVSNWLEVDSDSLVFDLSPEHVKTRGADIECQCCVDTREAATSTLEAEVADVMVSTCELVTTDVACEALVSLQDAATATGEWFSLSTARCSTLDMSVQCNLGASFCNGCKVEIGRQIWEKRRKQIQPGFGIASTNAVHVQSSSFGPCPSSRLANLESNSDQVPLPLFPATEQNDNCKQQ